MTAFRVHKFGGSSVADAACIQRAARILEDDGSPRLAVVVSACRGVTDALLDLVARAERQDVGFSAHLEAVAHRHTELAASLLDPPTAADYAAAIESDCRDIHGMLQAVCLIREASPALRDLVAGYGELWSSRLFAQYLRQTGRLTGRAQWVDARDVIQVEWGALGPKVQWEASRANTRNAVPNDESITLVIPGYVARGSTGVQTTLGRNGSDFSASIFAHLLDARDIIIWTDVDGVLSADPRLVPEATVIDSLSYNEAMELAYFGARVIHPQTMAPAVEKNIPIWIRNTFAPHQPGTLISRRSNSARVVKGITSIDRIALLNLEGTGMIGVPGTAQRLFSVLREQNISVVLISQASSEHSICFAVPFSQARKAEQVVRDAFVTELAHGQIQRVEVMPECSILAVVGDGMAGTYGVAAKVFGALGNAGVNVRAIAQGASERNISLVIDDKQTAKALRSVHARFYLSPHTVSIGVIGPGVVGGELLDQLASQCERLQREWHLDLRVRGISTSTSMVLSDSSLGLMRWRELLKAGEPKNLERFVAHIHTDHLPHAVIVDCTASQEVAECYPRWLSDGVHVVTPNKRANSGDTAFYASLKEACRHGGTHYLYEATVGAGLPIIQTIRDLRETGDEIVQVEGILSGTLSYLFNVWDGREAFSAIVRDARQKGYTEPDPRDDLSGMDVARKLVIVAREMGLALAMEDVELEGLVPEDLSACTPDEFLERLGETDARMLARFEAARRSGRVLRYVGRLDAATRRARVGVVELDRSHPFANINLTDNVVRFTTARYKQNPLVVQGPGAGPAVTAGGVFADLLRVCAYLGARP